MLYKWIWYKWANRTTSSKSTLIFLRRLRTWMENVGFHWSSRWWIGHLHHLKWRYTRNHEQKDHLSIESRGFAMFWGSSTLRTPQLVSKHKKNSHVSDQSSWAMFPHFHGSPLFQPWRWLDSGSQRVVFFVSTWVPVSEMSSWQWPFGPFMVRSKWCKFLAMVVESPWNPRKVYTKSELVKNPVLRSWPRTINTSSSSSSSGTRRPGRSPRNWGRVFRLDRPGFHIKKV